MTRVEKRYLVQKITDEYEVSKARVFIDYDRAVGYFKQLLGEYLLNAFETVAIGTADAKDLTDFFKENNRMFFEDGLGEHIETIPENAKMFNDVHYEKIVFGDFDGFTYQLITIDEEL